eukprot:TRINITY_DN10079_c0_g1_i1.p1 TRINITY_DN10079_c0_g1~~TRINITY_DN10079_c0_g1_i1.p1  ORF type:complete len:146 (-),score=49.42 TRINITY_DN10079_c0_g1_i1:18-407(-)
MSLSDIVRDHQRNREKTKDANDWHRKKALDSVQRLSGVMLSSVNLEISQIYNNQSAIEAETLKLKNETARFEKQAYQWMNLLESFNQSLKEIGLVDNWAKRIERDMVLVADTLEEVHRNQNDLDASYTE